ncbi:MAG: phosphatidylserine decarboxylase family protein [Nitrospirota bacterium]
MTNQRIRERYERMPVVPEGFPFIIPLLLIVLIVFLVGYNFLSILPLSLAAFVVFFFRNPERKIPEGEGIFVSPADGKVVQIKKVFEKDYLKSDTVQISIFLSVFNVHINRIPCSGKIIDVRSIPGKFLAAFREKASELNEQVAVVIKSGEDIVLLKQIAGVIARRVVCWLNIDDDVERGQRYGLIRFGSRVDVFLPSKISLLVKIGDKVKGGSTIIGVLR